MPTQDQLYTTLVEISKLFMRVSLVFDGLGECHPETRLVLVPMFQQMGRDGIYAFMTSRPLADIQRLLTSTVKTKLSARREDIVAYLQGKIANLREVTPAKSGLLEKYKDSYIWDCAGEM